MHHHLDSDGGYVQADDVAAFLADALADSPVRDASDAHVYVCGPTPFMDLVEAGAFAAGIPVDHIAIERFVNAAVLGDDGDAEAPAGRGRARYERGHARSRSRSRRKRHVLEHVAGDTVLDAARRATLNPPYSCEQGNCATCMALVTEGTVTMRVNNALTPDEVAEGWMLTCQALPTSPTLAVVYDDL